MGIWSAASNMSRPLALTDSQKHRLRLVKATRRELIRQLKSLPSRTELAAEMDVSERTIGRAMGDESRPRLMSLRELYA